MFEHDDGRDFYVFIECKDGTLRGLSRNYFSDKNSFGAKQLVEYRLEKTESHTDTRAKNKLDAITIDDIWYPYGQGG